MGFVLLEVSEEALAAIEALLKGSFRRLNVECSRIRGEVLVFEERLSSGDYHLLHSIIAQDMEW